MSGTQETDPDGGVEDDDLDGALEDTFPASDPPAIGGATGPDDKGGGDKRPADTLEERP